MAATHAHLDGIDKPTLAFGRSDEGVELGAANQRAEIFFLAISPSQTPNMQVQLLASIARLIESEYVLNRLRKAKTPRRTDRNYPRRRTGAARLSRRGSGKEGNSRQYRKL